MTTNTEALNPPEEAPTSGDTAPVEQPGADVTAAPSAESPGDSVDSPPAAGAKPPTLEDAISAALGEKEPEEKPTAPPAEEKAKSEQSDDEPEGKKDDPAQAEKKDDLNLDALSKKAQSRFRELSKENSEFRATLDEMKRYAGDEQGFNNFRELLRLHADDPAQAVPLLRKVLQDAEERAGLIVKSDDIKQKLDDGLLDEATARELEQARRERERLQGQAQKAELERKQRESEKLLASQTAALNVWEKSVRERNPDYDSFADLVQDRMQVLATAKYPETPDEAVALANQALADVTQRVKRFQPAKSPLKVQPSSGSSKKLTAAPKSLEDAIGRALGEV